jgi:hypothetical protein
MWTGSWQCNVTDAGGGRVTDTAKGRRGVDPQGYRIDIAAFARQVEERVRARLPHLTGEAFTAAVLTEGFQLLMDAMRAQMEAQGASPEARSAVLRYLEEQLRLSPGSLGD